MGVERMTCCGALTRVYSDAGHRTHLPGCQYYRPERGEFTPDNPRFPEITVVLTVANVGDMLARAVAALTPYARGTTLRDELRKDVLTATSFDHALHRIMCWMNVTLPGLEED